MKSRLVLALAVATLMLGFSPDSRAADDDGKTRILMVTQSAGFVHGSVKRPDRTEETAGTELAPAEIAMVQLGQETGLFQVDCTQDAAADFTKENLQNYDIVMFYTTGALPIADADRDYFINEWLPTKGHGFIGFHSAADTFWSDDAAKNEEYRWYWDMIGGSFNGHPWNANNTVTITVHDTQHPGAAPFGEEFQIKDEIYQYRNWQPEKVRVLMSLNMAKCEPKMPYHVPVAWAKNYGEGKVYFNNLGHNEETWANPTYMKAITGAIQWIRGDLEGDATPNPELSAEMDAKAAAVAPKQ